MNARSHWFPGLSSLSPTEVHGRTITLPDDCIDHVTLIFIAFRRETQPMIDS
jgi:hypothetical protein